VGNGGRADEFGPDAYYDGEEGDDGEYADDGDAAGEAELG
jgi:hypothetical protein